MSYDEFGSETKAHASHCRGKSVITLLCSLFMMIFRLGKFISCRSYERWCPNFLNILYEMQKQKQN